MRLIYTLIFFTCFIPSVFSQKTETTKKYPSLFWEITGNGMTGPSYLFGTMHVSSKMVFHLSDSFYQAMKNVDMVALELNPEKWQNQMFALQQAKIDLSNFTTGTSGDYLNEKSFQLQPYEDDIRNALVDEPTVINSLLYRSMQTRADFEENTYLDLYIFQTGRKLGKKAGGVEDFIESEKIMLDAYKDMATEKKSSKPNPDAKLLFDVQKKLQDAYRNGDLDLLDSLNKLTVTSDAFNEKFLYLRNEIQANSIDTILQNNKLFVGVGAAHLPGERGVIEMLRKKGYRLRPIFMQDRDAAQKDKIDKMKVPVAFSTISTEDGMITVKMPGQLYKRQGAKANQSWQYADMNNGSYYMLTRVQTHASLLGDNAQKVLHKVDSMLYDNIPGKIIEKKAIVKNGYNGFAITNKTRRGDIQRYCILVTPYEVLVFKMSGNENYVSGDEADTFFESIAVKEKTDYSPGKFMPEKGGFTVLFPADPHVYSNDLTPDKIDSWEYESVDKKTGNAYAVWKKSLVNFGFLEEDSFLLAMMEESILRSELVQKKIESKSGSQGGFTQLNGNYLLKNGGYLHVKGLVDGPHFYMLSAYSPSKKSDVSGFFKSFRITPYQYEKGKSFVDTAMNLEVTTHSAPYFDSTVKPWIEAAISTDLKMPYQGDYFSYWPKAKYRSFTDAHTGERILVKSQAFPKYYSVKDSATFWEKQLNEKDLRSDFIIAKKEYYSTANTAGYNLELRDTNSSAAIKMKYMLAGNELFTIRALTDTGINQSDFINDFYTTVKPFKIQADASVFENKLDSFFVDINSSDSLVKKTARQSISNMYFGKEGVDRIISFVEQLKYDDKDYFELKSKFIVELGYIKDSCCTEKIVKALGNIYNRSADTSYFQNPVFTALANLKTKESYSLLKTLLLQDPPIFDNNYDYSRLFNYFSDSLPLSKSLFPDILKLAAVDDYKMKINSLLKNLLDSGLITANVYEPYFSQLFFDAKIQLKKQQNKDEKRLEQEMKEGTEVTNQKPVYNSSGNNLLSDYATLLMPFYNSNSSVEKFFQKLLQTKEKELQLNTAVLFLKNDHYLPDSILANLAATDEYRARVYEKLEKIGKAGLLPARLTTQELIARSLLLNDKRFKKFAAIEFIKSKPLDALGEKGTVYYYKYKINDNDDWKLGISGLQPVQKNKVNTRGKLVEMTDETVKADKTLDEQFENEIKKIIFSKHRSSRNFFADGRSFFHSMF